MLTALAGVAVGPIRAANRAPPAARIRRALIHVKRTGRAGETGGAEALEVVDHVDAAAAIRARAGAAAARRRPGDDAAIRLRRTCFPGPACPHPAAVSS